MAVVPKDQKAGHARCRDRQPGRPQGRGAARWPAIQAELAKRLGPVEPMFTEAPGHATQLARDALAQGVRRFVAVGGDGTVNETLNGLLDPSGRLVEPDAVLCPVPAGTANELCRALGHLADAGSAFDAAASPRTQAIDLMRVRCDGARRPAGRPLRLPDRGVGARGHHQPSHVAVALAEEAGRDRLSPDDAGR